MPGESATSIARFGRQHPARPLFVTLTGTDLYVDLPRGHKAAARSIDLATRLITLQPEAADALPHKFRKKVRVIYQSVPPRPVPEGKRPAANKARHFDVFVIGHLRAVKDPFRAAMAVRSLPTSSRIRVEHYGLALSESMRTRAEQESQRNDRYHWHDSVPHGRLMRAMARHAALLVHSSKVEGGPHVISEAVSAGVPVLATDIPGNRGLLGRNYPGLFPVGDTRALRELLLHAEQDPRFYRSLQAACDRAAKLFRPEREQQSWQKLLAELL